MPQSIYFKYGTSSGNLNQTAYGDNSTVTSASGSFSVNITGLSASTTYYYKAYMEVWDGSGNYADISGTVQNFTTSAATQTNGAQYLTHTGMPDLSALTPSYRTKGTNDRDDNWYSYNTSSNNRQIVIHTYSSGAPNDAETLNYVVLYDGSNYAPVWTYHVMNTTYWPDNNVGRTNPDPWATDPAISLTQQTGLNNGGSTNNGGCGYSRGHLVASDYRQTNQNKQTFYYSNQAPQWQDSFNGGMWSTLEGRVKTISPSGTTMLYVVTGVLYEGTVSNGEVTSSTIPTLPSGSGSSAKNVPIPSHFYKCIMKCTFNGTTITGAQGIAFVYTNEAHSGNYYANTFVTSIDAIEERAGFNFFANVPGDYEGGLQNTAESNTNHYWFTGQGSPTNNVAPVTGNSWGTF